MIRGLTIDELHNLYEIVKDHLLDGRRIKYIDSVYDNRTCIFFTITFRHWGIEDTVFTTTNRCLDKIPPVHDNLYSEIIAWFASDKKE